MADLNRLLGGLSLDANTRGRQFEHICKWFLETDPVFAPQLKRVWLWRDWPGRWGSDAGIDLVAEATDGKLWAIQAKAYAPEYRIKKSDVDTFLSESSRPEFSYRLLIATTNHVGATALRTLEAQEKPAHLSLLGDLERAPVEWPTSPRHLVGRPAKPKKPRPHQKRAIRDVLNGFEYHDRGQLLMACGTGKTLVGLWLAEAMEARRTLVLVPSLSLLAQTLREWRANARRPFEALPVCSDETVRGEDLLISHTSDLPFPVTTDAADVAAFLRRRGPLVVFSTYQSSPKIVEALAAGRVPAFDLAIADEAHRCAGKVDEAFGSILDDKSIRARRRIFATATPRVATERVRRAAEDLGYATASMDDERQFGPVLHRLSFGEAIRRDLLTDYQVAVVFVDDETVRDYLERGVLVQAEPVEVSDARTLAAQIGLAKAMRRFDLRRVVTFHSRVDWARRFADSLPDVVAWMPVSDRPRGALWTDHVSGSMPSGERDVRLDLLRHVADGQRGLLSNARCLAEGVDVPTLDGVAFIDPRRSQVDVVQAVGRAIRKAENKRTGTIVLPVFLPTDSDDPEQAMDESVFEPIVQVLRALRDHDEVLGEAIDSLRYDLGRKGSTGHLPGKIHFIAPARIGKKFVDALDVRVIELVADRFQWGLKVAQAYAAKHGSLESQRAHDVFMNFPLGRWINTRRQDRKRGTLSAEKIAALDELGMVWDALEQMWQEGLAVCQAWVKEHGSLASVKNTDVYMGFSIGMWLPNRRQDRKRGTLSDEKIAALDELGIVWEPLEQMWQQALAACRAYRDEFGSIAPARKDERYQGFAIGLWLHERRQDRRKGKLTPEKIAALDELGMAWDRRHLWWQDGLAVCQAWAEGHGSLVSVKSKEVFTGFPIGTWLNSRRQEWRRGELPADKIEALNDLGIVWDPREQMWQEGLAVCQAWVKEHGSLASVKNTDVYMGFPIGTWLQNHRQDRKQGKLSDDKIAVLDALGIIWERRDLWWVDGLAVCQAWVKEHGSLASVKNTDVYMGFPIGTWLQNRRQERKRGTLAPDKIEALNDLGIVWERRDVWWQEGLGVCRAWAEEHGPLASVKSGDVFQGFRIGTWVNSRRHDRRKDRLSPDKIAALDELGMVWDALEQMWQEGLAVCQAWVKEHGSLASVKKTDVYMGFPIGTWLYIRRRDRKEGKLSPERIAALDELGIAWERSRSDRPALAIAP